MSKYLWGKNSVLKNLNTRNLTIQKTSNLKNAFDFNFNSDYGSKYMLAFVRV